MKQEQHDDLHIGEPIATGQPVTPNVPDRRQSAGRRAVDGVSPDRLLNSGIDTVIRNIASSPKLSTQGEASNSGLLDFTFTVQIARVLYKNPRDLSVEEKKLGIWAVAEQVFIPQGKHAGDMLILPISAGPSSHEKYLIDVIGTTGGKDVHLLLYANDRDKKVTHSATIPASRLTSQGFDLNPINPDNLGKTLRPNLTRSVFLPFLLGEDLSAPKEQLTTRRTLGHQPSSKDIIPSNYSIPGIIEANREVEYLGLMNNYLTLAIALGPQSSITKLRELADEELSTYINTKDAKVKRKIEDDLRNQLEDIQTTGFERTIEMLRRFKKDAGVSEDEVYHFEEEQRKRFSSTKKDRKIKMLIGLIGEKQKLAVNNLPYYIDAWKAIFPVGPRTLFWTNTIEHAPDDQAVKADISEALRDELGKKLTVQINDFSKQWQISSIDLGMPADVTGMIANQRIDTFRGSPLPAKIEIIREIENAANDILLSTFPITVKLWDLLTDGKQREAGISLSNSYSIASVDIKLRLARRLFRDVEEKMETRRKAYSKNVYQNLRERGLSKADATFELHKAEEKFVTLPRFEQLRVMASNELS